MIFYFHIYFDDEVKEEILKKANKINLLKKIMKDEGLRGWKIIEGEPYCWIKQKKIMLFKNSSFAMFLHELAHALSPEPEPIGKGTHFHDGHWASMFTYLVNKYMVESDLLKAVKEAGK